MESGIYGYNIVMEGVMKIFNYLKSFEFVVEF